MNARHKRRKRIENALWGLFIDVESALLANANAGGDNVHRGMVLGMLVGAATRDVPMSLRQGLMDYQTLAKEIEAFAELAVSARAF